MFPNPKSKDTKQAIRQILANSFELVPSSVSAVLLMAMAAQLLEEGADLGRKLDL